MSKPPVPTEIAENMKGIKHKIVILSGKGGVGKTTVATNLAVSFAKRGKNAGILDVDIYGPNVPKLLGLEGQHPTIDGELISKNDIQDLSEISNYVPNLTIAEGSITTNVYLRGKLLCSTKYLEAQSKIMES